MCRFELREEAGDYQVCFSIDREDPVVEAFDLSQQEPTAVRTELSAVKSGHDLTLSHPLETQLFDATLCLFHAAAPLSIKLLLALNLIARCGGFFASLVRNAG